MTTMTILKRSDIRIIDVALESIGELVASISERHIDGDYVGAAHDTLELIINECRRQQLELEGSEEQQD